jgi:predicted nucleotidyltransferase
MKKSVNILDQVKQIIIDKEPTAKIYLYGSRAHGTSKNDSDWDLLILVNEDQVSYELEKKLTDSIYDLEFDTGEVISPMIYSEKEWNSKYSITPFYHSVMKDAKPL